MKINHKVAGVLAGLMLTATMATPVANVAQAQGLSQGTSQGTSPRPSRLFFAPNTDVITRTGVLNFGGANRFVIKLGQNDNFSVSVDSGNNNVILIIWGADGTVLISDHADASSWSGITPSTQDYYIDVRAIDGTSANYTLSVYARPIQSGPPTPSIKRITFPPGTFSTTVVGQVSAGRTNEYVLKANAGQQMLVSVVPTMPNAQDVVLSVVGADGTVLLSSMPGASSFSGDLPSSQDYFLRLTGSSQTNTIFRLTVTVEPY